MNEKPRYRCEVAQLPSGRWKYWILHAAGLFAQLLATTGLQAIRLCLAGGDAVPPRLL
jgi:hypothetical protein